MAAIAQDVTLLSWAGEAASTWAAMTAIAATLEAASRQAFLQRQRHAALAHAMHEAAATGERRGCRVAEHGPKSD
jgi:hypothetical protein